MRVLLSALTVGLFVLGNGSAVAQNTKATLEDHENRITDLEGDVQALDGRVTALEGNGNGQGGPLVFVGYSIATVLGDVGVTGLTDECGEFGASARVCTTKEFMLSTNIAAPGGVGAWVLPEIVAATGSACADFSGRAGSCTDLSCSGWVAGGSFGMSVNTAGAIVQASCLTPRMVTCCAPAP